MLLAGGIQAHSEAAIAVNQCKVYIDWQKGQRLAERTEIQNIIYLERMVARI